MAGRTSLEKRDDRFRAEATSLLRESIASSKTDRDIEGTGRRDGQAPQQQRLNIHLLDLSMLTLNRLLLTTSGGMYLLGHNNLCHNPDDLPVH